MSEKGFYFVAGLVIASLFWILLAHDPHCDGSIAEWFHMGQLEECTGPD
jgi:hypothetical protein